MRRSVVDVSVPTLADFTGTMNSSSVDVRSHDGFGLVGTFTVGAPAAAVFASASAVDATENSFTKASHGFKTGLKGQIATSSALPTGLSAVTDYFVIVVSSSVIKFASSLANALAGTAIDISDVGTGNQTFTPTALAGASVKLQASLDDVTYVDVPSASNNITATSSFMWTADRPGYNYVRLQATLTAGQITAVLSFSGKETR